MSRSKSTRKASSINAGSMADIAFLLLIFFLVATTIANDKGLEVRLPPYYDGEPGSAANNNVMSIKINAKDQLLIEGRLSDMDQLQGDIEEFIQNPNHLKSLPSSPQKAIISIQNHVETSYEAYTKVYSIIKKAYRSLRNEIAIEHYGNSFSTCTKEQRIKVRDELPIRLSEAEPFDIASSN